MVRAGRLAGLAEIAAFAAAAAVGGFLAIQLAYRVSPLAPLIVAASLVAAFLISRRPITGVYLGIGLIPLEVLPLPLGTVATLSPAEFAFALTGFLWGMKRLALGQLPYVPSPLGKPLLVLLLALVPGLAVAQDSLPALKILIMWSFFFLLYQLVVAEAGHRELRNILYALAGAGAVIGAVAMVGATGAEQEVSASAATNRAAGTFAHPNNLATFLAMSLPASLALALRGPASARPAMLISFGLATAGLVASLSRGGLLAAAGALIVMVAWRPFRRIALALALVVLVVAVANPNPLGDSQALDPVAQRVESVSNAGRSDPRIGLWRELPKLLGENWQFGVGANNFGLVAPRYGLVERSTLEQFDHAHNIPLTIFAELGVLGLIGVAWLAIALVGVVWRALHQARAESQAIAFAAAGALFAVAIQGLVDYTLRSNALAAVVLTLMAVSVVLSRESTRAGGAGDGLQPSA
jgi:O-antigen ligase